MYTPTTTIVFGPTTYTPPVVVNIVYQSTTSGSGSMMFLFL